MELLSTRKRKLSTQYAVSIFIVLAVSLLCFLGKAVIGYRIAALILLMTVSVLAMLFEIYPVLISAVISAIFWNFFFIPPIFTFHIHNAEDLLMFFLYFIIAMVNAVLTFKIREAEKSARDKEEKENTIKLYNTLLNSLSHELRTPISAIIGAVDTLKESGAVLSPENRQELLTQIDIASIRLNREVENLLNMSRLESGLLKLNQTWCDVNELIWMAIQKIPIQDSLIEISFHPVESFPYCKLDPGLIEQVIYNLLANSIQHNGNSVRVWIGLEIDQHQLCISITDNGKGVPDDQLERIFTKFFRLSGNMAGGTGLGLSISRGIVEAHRGNLRAESVNPHGLRVLIRLPVETSYLNNLKNE